MSLVPGKSYPFTDKPTVRGDYCFWGYGWSSVAPCYAAFNGTEWVDGPGVNSDCFWIHTDKPEPYGHYNPSIPQDEPEGSDLASRLKRFKQKKLTG